MDEWSALCLLWTAHSSAPYSFLSLNILREIALYSASPLLHLVDLRFDTMRVFDFARLRWQRKTPLSKQIQVDAGSRWVLCSSEQLLCCGGAGGHRSLNTAYSLTLQGCVEELSPMANSRGNHGLIAWRHQVFVFGGCKFYLVNTETINTCEERPLQQPSSWRPLPHMRFSCANFNPCLYRNLIYVGSSRLEAFDPFKRCFTNTNIRLPETYPSLIYEDRGFLVVKSLNFTSKYVAFSADRLTAAEQAQKHTERDRGHNSLPAVNSLHRTVYCVVASTCAVLDTSTGQTSLIC